MPCSLSIETLVDSTRFSRAISSRSAYPPDQLKTDWRQNTHNLIQRYAPLSFYPALFGRGLNGMQRLSAGVNSISILHLTYQRTLLGHLDSLGKFCHRTTRAISVPTISANRVLPQKSVWSFRRRLAATTQPSAAKHTPEPTVNIVKEDRQALE